MTSLDRAHSPRKASSPVDSAFSHLDLPAEIWIQILRCLLIKRPEQRAGDTVIVISPLSDWTGQDSTDNRLSSQVLRTNRALNTAGIELLYSDNVFELNGDDVWVVPNFLSLIGRSNVSRIRHLRLDHRNAGYADCRGSPHKSNQDSVYVNSWLRDVWVERLFESFPTLQKLETLSIAVDLPSKKMHDSVAKMEVGLYLKESGLLDQVRAAKHLRDESLLMELHDKVLLYINKLGILRATTSLDQWSPKLSTNVYYGCYAHGAYGIFSVKELDTVGLAEEQKTARHLRPVSVAVSSNIIVVVNVLQVCRLQVDIHKGEIVEMQ